MSLGEVFFIGWSLLMLIISIAFFFWAKESGQLKNVEKAKFDMLEDREPKPWPVRDETNKPESHNENDAMEQGGPT